MLSQRVRYLLRLPKSVALPKIYSYKFSQLNDPNNPNKEVYDSIVRSSTASKTAFKSFLEAQDLVAYFPTKDPVRVKLLFGFHKLETLI